MKRITDVLVLTALLGGLPAGVAAQAAAAADPRDANITAYVELLRSDVRAQKVAFLTEMLELTDAEDAKFWPIYREYDAELSTLNDERVAMIKEYAANYGSVSDTLADALGRKAIDMEKRRTALLEKYYDRVKTVLSPKTAVRFLQVEHQLLLIVDLQIASWLPVVK